MKKSRYSEEQIVRMLRKADRDPVVEVAKRHGVSDASIYAWRKRFGEMVSSDVKRLNALAAVTTTMRSSIGPIRAWVSGPYTCLGTDGFGRSDTRAALRDYFQVDSASIVRAALAASA